MFSFSLRFCTAFKAYRKTKGIIKTVSPKCHTLHTVSTQNRFFWYWIWKKFVAWTCLQSVHAVFTFFMVLRWFLMWSRFGGSGPPGTDFVYFHTDAIIFLILLDAQIAISLGFYMELLHFIERHGVVIFYVCAGVDGFLLQIIAKMLQNLFWWPRSLLGLLGVGVSW